MQCRCAGSARVTASMTLAFYRNYNLDNKRVPLRRKQIHVEWLCIITAYLTWCTPSVHPFHLFAFILKFYQSFFFKKCPNRIKYSWMFGKDAADCNKHGQPCKAAAARTRLWHGRDGQTCGGHCCCRWSRTCSPCEQRRAMCSGPHHFEMCTGANASAARIYEM